MAESTPQIKAFLGFDGVGPRALTVRSKRNERSHSLTNEPSKIGNPMHPFDRCGPKAILCSLRRGQDAQLTKKKPAVAPSAAVSQLGIQ